MLDFIKLAFDFWRLLFLFEKKITKVAIVSEDYLVEHNAQVSRAGAYFLQ